MAEHKRSEKEKMIAGELYEAWDPELMRLRKEARRHEERIFFCFFFLSLLLFRFITSQPFVYFSGWHDLFTTELVKEFSNKSSSLFLSIMCRSLTHWFLLFSHRLTRLFNSSTEEEKDKRTQLLKQLFGKTGNMIDIEPPFHCDYGWNISVGDGFYMNFDCVILDVCPVTIGKNCLCAPKVRTEKKKKKRRRFRKIQIVVIVIAQSTRK